MDIKKIILQAAQTKKKIKTSDIVKITKNMLSRQYIVRMISKLVKKGKLIKNGKANQTFYALPSNAGVLGVSVSKHLLNKNLAEHQILESVQNQAIFLSKIKENIKSIFDYAFSEMLNNAIEHSHSKFINIKVIKQNNNLVFEIIDNGIGVFNSVMKKRKLETEIEAIQDLLKGKTTTAPKFHSGEGIFFTSKISDMFILESFNYKLRIDNIIKDVFIEPREREYHGTKVKFMIFLESKKHLNQIFKKYQTGRSDYAFDKTEIQVKLYTLGTIYISRSQARRILFGLEKFRTIILDFDKVPTIGQAFADEIFRVFKLKYPKINIKPVNMNEAVHFMISRAKNNK